MVVMEFSLDSLDGFPEDSDVLETSEGHVTDSPTKKTSSKESEKSKDKGTAIISNQEYHDPDVPAKIKESKGNDISQTGFKKLPKALENCQETSSDFTRAQCEHLPSSACEFADLATVSQQCPDHRHCSLKLLSTSNSISVSQTDHQHALSELATPIRGDTFVGVISHHHDLSPWERWVVQKARQERERREEKRLSDVSRQFCLALFPW